jgi:hypothetical protein
LSNYKKAVKLEEGKVQAQMRGLLKWKKSKKGMELSIREHIGKAIDRLNPLDVAAVIAGTIIIKPILDSSTEVVGRVANLWKYYGAELRPIWETGIQPIWQKGAEQWGVLAPPTAGIWNEEVFKWCLAFFLSYMIVKYGGQLMGLLDKGISAIALMLLG